MSETGKAAPPSPGFRLFAWSFLKKLLFRLDAETAHRLTVRSIRFARRLGEAPLRIASGSPALPAPTPKDQGAGSTSLASRDVPVVFGMPFLNPVGLAAGFDKDAEL